MDDLIKHESATCKVRVSTAIPGHMRDRVRELVKLNVPTEDRKKGYATALLHKVCEQADEASVLLFINVQPYGDIELSKGQLEAWYRRFGFETIQDEPRLMARPNQTPRVPQ